MGEIPEIRFSNPEGIDRLFLLRRERRTSWRAFGLGTVIASFADAGDGRAWPSRATLERISGIESRDIPRVTSELQKAGFLAIKERGGQSNVYLLTCGEIAVKPMGKQPHNQYIDQLRNWSFANW